MRTRIDPRDAAWAVGLLAHAIEATGADRERLVSEAAALATPAMAKILMRAKEPSRLSEWGYRRYKPRMVISAWFVRLRALSADASTWRLALRLAARLQRGPLHRRGGTRRRCTPAWFEKRRIAQMRSNSSRRARGSISVQGTLRKAYTDKPFAQQFVQWVVEMPSAEEADYAR